MKIYFLCYPQGPPDKAGYQHQVVGLAEGLKEHGIEFFSNINYWKIRPGSNEYLLNAKPDHHYEDFDVVVVNSMFYDYGREDLLPEQIFSKKRKFKLVFIDRSDGYITPGFLPKIRNADLVLKSHYNRKYTYPENFVPWQFGLSNRIISSLNPLPFDDRQNEILVNYRVQHNVRNLAEKKVMGEVCKHLKRNSDVDSFDERPDGEYDRLYWEQTGRRHSPAYYKRLERSKACAAFGGTLQNSLTAKQNIFSKYLGKVDYRYNFLKHDRVYQYDSWRFWESLASGCVTLHLDFDKYGAVIPEMPQNDKHYLGIDLSDLKNTKKRIAQIDRYKDISHYGREWVLKYYTPKIIAARFLNLLE